jgi:hypothetical protein
MPVTAAGAEESQLTGEIGEAGASVRIVAGVPSLHCIQSLLLQAGKNSLGTAVLEMGGGDQPADRMDQRRHLGEGRQPLGDVAGARPPTYRSKASFRLAA